MEFATLDWLDRFNNRRLLQPNGDLLPVENEEPVFLRLEGQVGQYDLDETTFGKPGTIHFRSLAYIWSRTSPSPSVIASGTGVESRETSRRVESCDLHPLQDGEP